MGGATRNHHNLELVPSMLNKSKGSVLDGLGIITTLATLISLPQQNKPLFGPSSQIPSESKLNSLFRL